MADTAVALSALELNDLNDDPAGTAVTAGDTAVITPVKARKVLIRVVGAASCVVTVSAGDNPPAHGALYGAEAHTVGATTKWLVLEPHRYMQDNGTYRLAVSGGNATSVTAFELPDSL